MNRIYPFPLQYLKDLIDVLAERPDLYEVITYKDLDFGDDCNFERSYPVERQRWLSTRDPDKIYFFIQYDLDAGTEDVAEILAHHASRKVRSVSMLLREAVNGQLLRDEGRVESLPFEVDCELLAKYEKGQGFEIGYHGNAWERAAFDKDRAYEIFENDLKFFKKRFDLHSYCPHGGVCDKDGNHNHTLVPPWHTHSWLKWVLIRHWIRFDGICRDGGHYNIPDPEKRDFRDFIKSTRKGGRYVIHMHPLYYSDNYTPSSRFSGTSWYDEMLEVYGKDEGRSFWDEVRRCQDQKHGAIR